MAAGDCNENYGGNNSHLSRGRQNFPHPKIWISDVGDVPRGQIRPGLKTSRGLRGNASRRGVALEACLRTHLLTLRIRTPSPATECLEARSGLTKFGVRWTDHRIKAKKMTGRENLVSPTLLFAGGRAQSALSSYAESSGRCAPEGGEKEKADNEKEAKPIGISRRFFLIRAVQPRSL